MKGVATRRNEDEMLAGGPSAQTNVQVEGVVRAMEKAAVCIPEQTAPEAAWETRAEHWLSVPEGKREAGRSYERV